MNAITTTYFAVGDQVTIDHPRCVGQVYVVTRVKQTKCFVSARDNQSDRGLDVPMAMMSKYDPSQPMPARPMHPAPAQVAAVGEVVRLTKGFRQNSTDTLLVVTKVNASTISLDPLGGPSNGTPMRCHPSAVVKVDLADILR